MDFVEKARIMDGARINRALARLASEIVEENHGATDLYLVGIRRRGVPLAERMADKIADLEGNVRERNEQIPILEARSVDRFRVVSQGRHREAVERDYLYQSAWAGNCLARVNCEFEDEISIIP